MKALGPVSMLGSRPNIHPCSSKHAGLLCLKPNQPLWKARGEDKSGAQVVIVIQVPVLMLVTLQLKFPRRGPCYCRGHGAGGKLHVPEGLYSVV